MNPLLRLTRRLAGAWLVLAALLPAGFATAQSVSLYGFAADTGTYRPLTNATPVTINGGGGSTDDGYSTPLALPFSFQFGAATFNTVTLVSNGYLGFGTHTTLDNYRVFRHPAENNVVAYANVDLEASSDSTTSYRVVTEGAAPNRIWKMQAEGFQRYQGVGGVSGKTGKVQVWLYEGTNAIELHYGTFSSLWGTGSFQARFDSVQVGLRGVGRGDLVAIRSDWQTPQAVNSPRAAMLMDGPAGLIPDSTLVFRFTPPAGTDLTPPFIGTVLLTPPPGCTPAAHVLSIDPTDASGIGAAVLTWSVGGNTTTTVPMTNNGGVWSATIPAQGTSQVNYTLVVTDASPQQNQSTTTGAYADGQVIVDAGPAQTITTGTAATLAATGNPTAALKISEITLNNFTTGRTFPRPSYIGAEDDFVELANIGAIDLNLAGYSLEVAGTGVGVARTYTFPRSAYVPAQGVLVLHLGPGTDQPANRYYHTGGAETLLSGVDVGFILRTPGGVIIDAVPVNNYSFGAAVPALQWSGPGAASLGGIAGTSLIGADTNDRSSWVQPTDTSRQTLGAFNPGLLPLPYPEVRWSGGVLPRDTTANPLVTPVHPTPGTYTYTATLTQDNCTVTDQVTVTVVDPVLPRADFTVSATTGTQNTVFTFTDLSTNLPNSWRWTFTPNLVQYVNGTSATSRNPQVRLVGPGCFTVALTATNGAGADTETKAGYVCISLDYCGATLQTNACDTAFINGVLIRNTSFSNRGTGCTGAPTAYTLFPAADSTTLTLRAGQRYTIDVTNAGKGAISVWIDYNGNGAFEGNEYTSVARGSLTAPYTASVAFTVPTTIVTGTVRMRVRSSALPNSLAQGDGCATRANGETEDYWVTLETPCALPAPSPRNNGPLCGGSTLNLVASNVPPNATYLWTGPNGFRSTALAPSLPNVTAANAGTYSVQVTIGGCTSAAATTTVVVNTPPPPPPALSVSRCGPGSVTLRFTTVPPGIAYRWYTTATGGAPIAGAGNSLTTPSLSATTNYYVSAVQNGCESARTTAVAVINAAPAAPTLTAAGPTTFCAGGSVRLVATGAPQGTNYVFKISTTVAGTNLIGELAATQTGNYTVTVTTPEGCAATSTPVSVTVTPQPTAAFAYPQSTICRNSAVIPRPTISGTTGGTFSATPAGLTLLPTTGLIQLGASQPGTYTVTYTVGTTCPASASQTVTITAAPAATFAYNLAAGLCARTDTVLQPSFPAGSSAGNFSATPTGLTLAAATGLINVRTSQPGTYVVTNTIAAGGSCAPASARDTVRILPTPTVAVTRQGAASFCQGDSAVLTAAAPSGSTFLWTTGATTPSITVRQSGTYAVTVRNAAGCEAASGPEVIVVTPRAAATFSYPARNSCLSDTSALVPTLTGAPGGTFTATPSGLTLNAATGVIARATSRPGRYAVTYAVGGVCPATATDSVILTAPPQAAFSYPRAAFCLGAPDTLRAVPAFGTGSGTYSATPAGLTLDPATGAVRLATSAAGTYTVRHVVAGAGTCQPDTATATLTITPTPALVITNLNAQYCTGDTPAPLTGTVNGVPGLGTFYLDGQPATVLNPALLGPGPHTVRMVGSNLIGCRTETTQAFTVIDSPPQPTFTVQPVGAGLVQLTSGSATGNQWYFNGAPIAGATGPTYTLSLATQSGNYSLVVTLNGCASPPANPQTITVTATPADLAAAPVALYPNPTTDGRVTLSLPAFEQAGRVDVLDAVGRVVFTAPLAARTASHELNLRSLPTGVYVVRCLTPAGPVIRRLVRE